MGRISASLQIIHGLLQELLLLLLLPHRLVQAIPRHEKPNRSNYIKQMSGSRKVLPVKLPCLHGTREDNESNLLPLLPWRDFDYNSNVLDFSNVVRRPKFVHSEMEWNRSRVSRRQYLDLLWVWEDRQWLDRVWRPSTFLISRGVK